MHTSRKIVNIKIKKPWLKEAFRRIFNKFKKRVWLEETFRKCGWWKFLKNLDGKRFLKT